ncbi:MAG: tRNA (guanosine(46)-N7)-methyltransferase TrmB [Bacilli bacterium]
MRLKNVKNAATIIENSKYVIDNPTNYYGRWKETFGNKNIIKIEIGMGKGDFIIENALTYPDVNFIGIEMFDSVMVRAVQKLNDKLIPNLRLIKMDASKIDQVFNHEIDTIFLNFSDPWPKTRHSKRRLTSHVMLNQYNNTFKDKRTIIQKTDNINFFAFSISSLSTYGYVLEKVTLDLHKEMPESNIMTEYEKRFFQEKKKICMLEAVKE